jgi:hypothetical protein
MLRKFEVQSLTAIGWSTPSQAAEKVFFLAFRAKIRPQVIESSFVEMLEITSLLPFSAACSGVQLRSVECPGFSH